MIAPAPQAATDARLRVEGLACRRGERTVFQDLSFALAPGEALVLTGPNGAGKTSLLRVLAGLTRGHSGRVLWDGADTAEEPEAFHADVHLIGHADAVKPNLSVERNLAFWARLRGAGDVGAALAGFGLDQLAALPAGLLSAGQRRRLALARLLASPAALWLLDEPAVTLDRAAHERLDRAIAGHRGAGGLTVVATHGDIVLADARRLELGTNAA